MLPPIRNKGLLPAVSGPPKVPAAVSQSGARLKASATPPVPPSESADAASGIYSISLEKAAGSGSGGCLAFGDQELVEMLHTGRSGTVLIAQEMLAKKMPLPAVVCFQDFLSSGCSLKVHMWEHGHKSAPERSRKFKTTLINRLMKRDASGQYRLDTGRTMFPVSPSMPCPSTCLLRAFFKVMKSSFRNPLVLVS